MPPAIVLLPGMDGTGELFSPFLASLGSEFETLIIRYPTNRPLGYGELAALTQSQLPTDKQYVLLAESFSGPIAISIAASNPIGLAGIILCASFAKNPRPKLRYLMPLLAIVPPGWIPRAVLSQLFFGRFAREGLGAALRENLKRVDAAVIRRRLWSVVNVDVSIELSRIAVPSLYLMASEDPMVPSTAATPFKQLSTTWAIGKIAGSHLLLQAVPHEVAKAVKNFIDRLR